MGQVATVHPHSLLTPGGSHAPSQLAHALTRLGEAGAGVLAGVSPTGGLEGLKAELAEVVTVLSDTPSQASPSRGLWDGPRSAFSRASRSAWVRAGLEELAEGDQGT